MSWANTREESEENVGGEGGGRESIVGIGESQPDIVLISALPFLQV